VDVQALNYKPDFSSFCIACYGFYCMAVLARVDTGYLIELILMANGHWRTEAQPFRIGYH